MRIQTISMFVVLTGFVGSTVTTAQANDLVKAIKNIQAINKGVQTPKFVPKGNVIKPLGPGKFVKTPKLNLPKPVVPGKIINVPKKPALPPMGPGGLVNVPKPLFPPLGPGNIAPKPPAGPPVPVPPVGNNDGFGLIINLPNPIGPHPGHVKPIGCKPPIKVCPKCGHQHCHCNKPPINKPPMKKFTMKLLNNAETNLFFSINGLDYQLLEAHGVELVKSLSPKLHRIAFHNGVEVVEFDLDPSAIYSFEWEEDQLMLYEIEG